MLTWVGGVSPSQAWPGGTGGPLALHHFWAGSRALCTGPHATSHPEDSGGSEHDCLGVSRLCAASQGSDVGAHLLFVSWVAPGYLGGIFNVRHCLSSTGEAVIGAPGWLSW